MSEKTEEQIAKEVAAVASMKGAKSQMQAVLERVETLERALRSAQSSIGTLKGYIAPGAYTYPVSGTSRKCTDVADAASAEIAKVLI